MKRTHFIILLLGILLLGISLTYTAYIFYYVIDYKELTANVTLDPYIQGFNLRPGTFHFGTIIPGYFAERSFNISTKKDAFVKMEGTGEMGKWLEFRPNNFRLNASEGNKQVYVRVYPPKNATIANYSTTIKIYFIRP